MPWVLPDTAVEMVVEPPIKVPVLSLTLSLVTFAASPGNQRQEFMALSGPGNFG